MSKDERQNIFEIYRACRLCGAGAGYKMPIIQSVIDADGEETELKQKIRECVQLEVSLNDRMPPLICELCVDKINDFFDFRAMCHENNKRTRLRLGLPLQTVPEIRGPPEKEDCILGVTEPVYVDSDSDDGPLASQTMSKSKPRPKSAKMKKEGEIKIENHRSVSRDTQRSSSPDLTESRELRKRGGPASKRTTKQSTSDELSLTDLQGMHILQKPTRTRPGPKSVMKREREKYETETEIEVDDEFDDNSLLVPRSKRPREKEIINYGIEIPQPSKKPKLPDPPKTGKVPKPGPKSSKAALKPVSPPPQPSITSKPGPKSKKRESSPVQTVNPKKSDPMPAPKSRKSEVVSVQKSKKSEPSRGSDLSPAPGPRSRKSELSSAPDSRSRKSETSPASDPRSRKSEISPSPSSRKSDTSPAPSSRSKKSELSAAPGPKSKKPVSVQMQKSKKVDTSTAVTSKMKKRESGAPASAVRASPQSQKALVCCVCGIRAKAAQGLSSHLKSHVPGYTPARLSCDPCESWYPTAEEAARHHRAHAAGLPYTCARCYGDFATVDHYTLHFERKQCLPTYEVPDVKCEVCWRFFPTYKLLEDHKCPGEGHRPGGKCSKCNRVYASLKSLTVHEMRCTSVKKKGPEEKIPAAESKSETIVDPEVSRRLLPMQVRIARCDPLLKNPRQDRYDVSGISHRYGLDSNFSYPYLYSMGDLRIKTELSVDNLNHMVSIKDEIKEEYLNNDDSFVHWDSDDSNDSDDTPFDTPKNAVDTLSKISLKTLFSPKCLGKVPKKKRKFKSETRFTSILSIDFPKDIKSNIDNIIDNLGNESHHSDNDSDSILGKRIDQNKGAGVDTFDVLKANETVNIASSVDDNRDKETVKSDSVNVLINKADRSKDEESNTEAKLAQNGSNDENSDSKQSEHISNQVEKVLQATEASNRMSDETADSPQKLSGSSNETKNLNLNPEIKNPNDVVVRQNNNECLDDSKKHHEVRKQNSSETELLHIKDNVENNTAKNESEKMDLDEQIELKSAESTNIHPLTDIEKAEMNELEKEKKSFSSECSNEINNENPILKSTGAINHKADLTNENNDSQSSDTINFKEVHDLKPANDDSQSSVAIIYEAIDDINNENNDSQSSDAISYKAVDELNAEKDDPQSTDAINTKATDASNAEKNNSSYVIEQKSAEDLIGVKNVSQSSDTKSFSATNDTNHSNPSKTESENYNVDKIIVASDSINKNYNENEECTVANSFNLNTEDDRLAENVQIADKFNINDLNDDEKRLMAELDEQIGENQSINDAIDRIRPENVIGDSRIDNGVIGENRIESLNNQNRVEDSDSENKQNQVLNRNDSTSVVVSNVGFDMNSEENVDNMDSFIRKQDDLKSLDLDSISDDEFDFDL